METIEVAFTKHELEHQAGDIDGYMINKLKAAGVPIGLDNKISKGTLEKFETDHRDIIRMRWIDFVAKQAPWFDFVGNKISEGDIIEHPSGERGKVVFIEAETEPDKQWRVDYGNGMLSSLALQVGDRGRAVVKVF